MSEPTFIFDGDDPAMQQAYAAAQRSFKYFWRELSWERRRIIPGLDLAMVKLPFTDGPRTDGQSEYEHMWLGDVDFDGETLSGTLLNAPNALTSVGEGDVLHLPFTHLTDWLIAAQGQAYGGFTVNLIRSHMGRPERQQHDAAWGLDFGDPAAVRLEIAQGAQPKRGWLAGLVGGRAQDAETGFQDHPMGINMLEKFDEQLKADAAIVRTADDTGWTLLHREALAGNLGVVKLLVGYGAEVGGRTRSGRTAADLARGIGWPEIADYLDQQV
jgi:uncharacterized protein YegJ (DUF2314 family)